MTKVGSTEKEHAAFLLANKGEFYVVLDNDCYGIYANTVVGEDDADPDGGWFYNCHPDRLFRAVLDAVGVQHEEV